MTCFIDTSAFYAVLDGDDRNHAAADAQWTELLRQGVELFTTSYVLVETYALLQHRLGLAAVRTFREDVYPLLHVDWIDRELHDGGTGALLSAQRRQLSLVDCISFESMRRRGVRHAFVFDPHFAKQGFLVLPREE